MTGRKLVSFLFALLFMLLPLTGIRTGTEVYAASASAIESALRKGFDNFETEIKITDSLKDYEQSTIDAYQDKLLDVHRRLILEKKYFYVEDHIEIKDGYVEYDPRTKKCTVRLTAVKKYICRKDKLREYRKKFLKELNKYTSGIGKSMTDIQKAAYLHDRLILNTTYLDNDGSRYTSTPYSALVDKKAICSGYARTYSVLLTEAGIESRYISGQGVSPDGTTGPHGWNLVRINKQWYHVDCTFDDADTSTDGSTYPYFVRHEYFLKSDSQLKQHMDYDAKGLASSTAYDNMDWDSYSAFAFRGSNIIYLGGDAIRSLNTKTNKIKKLLSISDKWEIIWDEYYPDYVLTKTFTTDENLCTIAVSGDIIYYNLAHAVYRYDLKTGRKTTVYSNKKSDSMITDVYISGGKLYGTFTDKDKNRKKYFITKV